jgi:adhesin/invasin
VDRGIHRSVDAFVSTRGSRYAYFVETWCDVSTTTSGLRYSVSVMEDNAPANGFSENSVLVRASGADDAPCPGRPIAFSADNGAVLLATDAVTNHYGVARVGVVSARVGRCTVTVVDGDGKRRSIAVTFTERRSGLILALR